MRILSDDEEVKHIVCFLKMTLNIHDEDENYVKLLNYKGNPETLIRIDTIKRIFGSDIFIPNVMGTLVKNHKGEIVSPTMLWLKWNKIPEFIDNGFLSNEFENGINNNVPEDKADALFFNEKYLIKRGYEKFMHWKMRSEFIILHNKVSYDSFMKNFGNNLSFGKKQNQKPGINDFIQYMIDAGPHLNLVLVEPHYMTVLVSIEKIKEYFATLSIEEREKIKIHESIKHIFSNESTTSTSKEKQRVKIFKKSSV